MSNGNLCSASQRRIWEALRATAPLCLVPALAGCVALSATVAEKPDFGPNVLIISPSMPAAAIQEKINAVYATQADSQFGPARNALLFMPGRYNVDVPIGFYTQVLGLGASPDKVDITGNLKAGPARGNGALVTFWRSAEGLSVKPPNGVLQWAVSQAAPFRRMHVRGDMVLHQNNGFASGGWMSDTLVDGTVSSGPQQQWVSRNTQWGGWKGANWNMVFVGVVNPPEGAWPTPAPGRCRPTVRAFRGAPARRQGRTSRSVGSTSRGPTQTLPHPSTRNWRRAGICSSRPASIT